MKQDARMAWYMAASRRPSLLKRESLIKLHSIVGSPEISTTVKSDHWKSFFDLCGRKQILIPNTITAARLKIGEVVVIPSLEQPTGDLIATVKSEYFIIHFGNWVCGIDYQRDTFKLIVLNSKDAPAFEVHDFLIVYAGDIENFSGNKFATTCGRYLVNYYLIASIFFNAPEITTAELNGLAFINDKWNIGKVESAMARLLMSKLITVADCNTYIDHGYFLSSVSELCGAVMTKKSITPNEDIIKLRNGLYEKYKGHLKDPRIGTIIENELIAADKEQLKNDPAMAFIGDMSVKFDTHRKRQYLTMGLLEDFDSTKGNYEYIQRSLAEGWDAKSFVAICNEIRKGSYDRGVETQTGGLDTKWMMAVFQNCKITGEDCGTSRTLSVVINQDLAASYFGAHVQTDKDSLNNPKFMDFSKDECEEFEGHQYLHVTCDIGDRKKYKLGELITTPWKQMYVVSSKIEYPLFEDTPFFRLATAAQLKKFTGKPVVVIRIDELDSKSKYVALTEHNYHFYLDTPIKIRSMQYCQQPDGFCRVCAGKIFQDLDFDNIGTLPIDVGAVFLALSMKSMHGTKVQSFELTLQDLEKYIIV